MTAPNDGGPAFPVMDHSEGIGSVLRDPGMTLRDYFAAQALPALLLGISQTHANNVSRGCNKALAEQETESAIRRAPAAAYVMADAMLIERAKART